MKICKIFLAFLVLLGSFSLRSQTYEEDPRHYTERLIDPLTSHKSDVWNLVPQPAPQRWGIETFDAKKVQFGPGGLKLECEKTSTGYISGGISSNQPKVGNYFEYGYFEIESDFPDPGKPGAWGGFWLFGGAGDCTTRGNWQEIDIMEPKGSNTLAGNSYRFGTHKVHDCVEYHPDGFEVTHPNLGTSFNKYAISWTPGNVKFYLNGIQVGEQSDPRYVPSYKMAIFLTFQVSGPARATYDAIADPNNWGVRYWLFRNLKVYSLKWNCQTGIDQSNFTFAGHDYYVQKYYKLSNSTVPNNSSYVLRATDYIELNGDFNVPLGSSFTATTHNGICP